MTDLKSNDLAHKTFSTYTIFFVSTGIVHSIVPVKLYIENIIISITKSSLKVGIRFIRKKICFPLNIFKMPKIGKFKQNSIGTYY